MTLLNIPSDIGLRKVQSLSRNVDPSYVERLDNRLQFSKKQERDASCTGAKVDNPKLFGRRSWSTQQSTVSQEIQEVTNVSLSLWPWNEHTWSAFDVQGTERL